MSFAVDLGKLFLQKSEDVLYYEDNIKNVVSDITESLRGESLNKFTLNLVVEWCKFHKITAYNQGLKVINHGFLRDQVFKLLLTFKDTDLILIHSSEGLGFSHAGEFDTL